MSTYLFDFDGTLVNSMPVFCKMLTTILDDHGISYGEDMVKIVTPMGYIGAAEYFVNTLGLQMTQEEVLDWFHEYAVEAYSHTVEAKAHVIETLRALKARGDDLNVLTASEHLTLDPCLKRLGVYDLFTNVWSCYDFDMFKSDPKIYHVVAERLGKPIDQIIFIDDNYNADCVAKSAGMQVWGIYDDSSADFVEEMKAATDRYIYDFAELLD